MEHNLAKAKESIYRLDEEGAKAYIRKVTALGVTVGESFGFPER